MGRMQALEMGHLADNLDQALRWHLQSNHFPPITLDLLPVAKEAIKIANEAIELAETGEGIGEEVRDLWDAMIYVPTAGKELPVWRIIEGMHLDSFLDAVQEDVYEDESEYDPIDMEILDDYR